MIVEFPELGEIDQYDKVLNYVNARGLIGMERKYDGTACMVDIFPDQAPILWGRGILKSGFRQVYTENFPEITEYFKEHSGRRIRFLGELVVFNGEKVEKFKWIQQRATRKYGIEELAKELPATFMVFDILIYNGVPAPEQYHSRRKLLEEVIRDFTPDPRFRLVDCCLSQEDKEDLLFKLEELKFEGIVVKDLTSSRAYKYKPCITEDVIWFGEYNEGTGRNEGKIGSLITYQYINGELVEVANVGGLTDALRDHLTGLTTASKVSRDNPMVIEINAMSRGEKTKKGQIGKFRHPRYSRIRFDKSPKQCVRKD